MHIGWRLHDAAAARTKQSIDSVDLSLGGSTATEVAAKMLRQQRVALLLRPKVAHDLGADLLREAIERIQGMTCNVPAGRVRIDRWQVDESCVAINKAPADECYIEAFRLQRCVVTNSQFQAFVDHGGYHQSTLWHASVWPRVSEFVDRSGMPGPRFWSDGQCDERELDHPVVGVSWFEAEAYARWIGMRLPSDGEWLRAASAPIESDGLILQRKYPWGDGYSDSRANLRNADEANVVAANAYASGDSAFGARQMIGNVWEWTANKVDFWHDEVLLDCDQPLKSVRGGAFNSCAAPQATCQFRSADNPLARRRSIGFRCAVSVADLVELVEVPSEQICNPAQVARA